MNDNAVSELVRSVDSPTFSSLVLVPAEQTARAHLHRTGEGRWNLTLDCRRVLSDLMKALVRKASGSGPASACDVAWLGHNCVRVSIDTPDLVLLARLLGAVVDDHVRTSPGTRLAAILLNDDDGCAPHRVEVVKPAPPRPLRSATTRLVPLGRIARA